MFQKSETIIGRGRGLWMGRDLSPVRVIEQTSMTWNPYHLGLSLHTVSPLQT